MTSELAQFIRSHRRAYPRGVPLEVAGGVARVAFYSPAPLTDAEREVLIAAAEKGLKLSAQEYAISIGEPAAAAHALIALGAHAPQGGQFATVVETASVANIIASAETKRSFWEAIKFLQKR